MTGRLPDQFYRMIAGEYVAAGKATHRPAHEVAARYSVPISTVHGWVKEARRRALCPGGERSSASSAPEPTDGGLRVEASAGVFRFEHAGLLPGWIVSGHYDPVSMAVLDLSLEPTGSETLRSRHLRDLPIGKLRFQLHAAVSP